MNSAIERKLNLIYDLLEAREFKKALKQCQTSIQKLSHPVFYAAQALTLQRMGKIQEALEAAGSLKASKLEDRTAIEILTLMYRSLGLTKEAAEMYELQYEQQPAVDTGEALFNTYATDFELEKQFSLAMKLFKNTDQPKYALWGILSLVLSVELARSKPVTLGLAEQLLNKLFSRGNFQETEQTFRIQMAIARLGGKTEKLLTLLQTKGQLLDNAAERVELTAKCQRDLGLLETGLNTLEEVLKLNVREETALSVWQLYQLYIEIAAKTLSREGLETAFDALEGWEGDPFPGFLPGEDGISIGRKVLSNLKWTQIAIQGSSSFSRNIRRTGLLAELEFYRQISSLPNLSFSEESGTALTRLVTPLVEYLRMYYDIPSAPEDLVPYLRLLTQEQGNSVVGELDRISDVEQTSGDRIAQIRRLICYTKIKRYLGTLVSSEDLGLVLSWFQTYKDLIEFEPPPKKGEHRVGDELLLLAAELLRDSPHPLRAPLSLLMLQYGVQASPYNFNLKIRLMEIWQDLSYSQVAFQLYGELDIKAIQQETLGHLMFSDLQNNPSLHNELQSFCQKVEHFHRMAITDLSESLSTAYSFYNYEGIKDFLDFKQRLFSSQLKPVAELSALYCKVIDQFQRIKDVGSMLKDSAPTIIRLLGSSGERTVLCDPACFYACQPIQLRPAGVSPASFLSGPSPPSQLKRDYGLWARPVLFKAYAGLLLFVANFLNPDHELFNQTQLDLAQGALEAATVWETTDPLEKAQMFGFQFLVALLKFSSAVLIVVKGDKSITSEALESAKVMLASAKARAEELKVILTTAAGDFRRFLQSYETHAFWPMVFGSILLAAATAMIPEPKKKGKKTSEGSLTHTKLTYLTKELGEILQEIRTVSLSAVQVLRSPDAFLTDLRNAFELITGLSDVPEFLRELSDRCSKEQSAPVDFLVDWLSAYPIHRSSDLSS